MKILVTGATGFIGEHLIKTLAKTDIEVYALVRYKSDITHIEKYCHIERYNENINQLIYIFKQNKFDGVVHLASLFLSTHTQSDISDIINSNILFGTQLL